MKRSIIKVLLLLLFMPFTIKGYSQQLEFMGLPIHSSITEFSKELTSHRFKDRYPNGDLAHQFWEGGDFWKQNNCYVHLFARDDIHVDLIEVTIPPKETPEDYSNSINELITDISNKYGQFVIDTLGTKKEQDIFFRPPHLKKEDIFYVLKWSLNNGELKVGVCPNRLFAILIQYKSIEYIHWNNEASRFKGKGSSDL